MAEENNAQPAQQVKKTSALGITSLVLGIVGLVGSWIPILNNASFFIALFGVLFGVIGLISIARSKGTKGGKGLTIVATLISVVAIVVVLATQSIYGKAADEATKTLDKAAGNATEEILNKDVTVDFGDYAVDEETIGSYVSKNGHLTVTVTNLNSESKTYNIQLEAVDSAGNRIQSDYVYASNLASGQSTSSDVFNAYTEDVVDQYANATFKVVQVSQY
ncbi:MAG: DUF4190 domain-containing protein [Phoenicibacter congonensis]|uniref:DUF4190 domain-containing protein n=1 Tax=Phoenicibacter congonensis TaxID=1944646 RepID=A0AA43RGC1_9ACTN|nr:DUF4190 domain-containing protein [Phoenicibacter congonensis]